MDRNRSVAAIFEKLRYDLNPVQSADGSIGGGGIYEYGESANFEAHPNDGFIFKDWVGEHAGAGNPLVLEVKEETSIAAVFSQKSYSVSVSPSLGGSVRGEGTYEYGATVELIAEPVQGYIFSAWVGTQWNGKPAESNHFENICDFSRIH